MNDDLTLAYALARALTEGKTAEELSRMQGNGAGEEIVVWN